MLAFVMFSFAEVEFPFIYF